MLAELRMLKEIMSPEARRLFALVLGLAVVSGFSTLVGVGSVVPFMALVADPGVLQEQPRLHALFQVLGFASQGSFLIFLGAAMLVALAVSNLLTTVSTWAGLSFSSHLSQELSTRLLRAYLNRPYSWFLDQNTTELGKNILTEVYQAVAGFIQPLATGVVQGFTALLLLSLIVAVDPVVALVTVVALGGSYLLVYLVIQKRVRRLGELRIEHEQARYKVASEALQGLRELRLLQRRDAFAEHYSAAAREASRVGVQVSAIQQIPRPLLETLAFAGIIGVIIHLLFTHGSVEGVLPLLSLYAVCAIRLLPAVQQAYKTVTMMRFNTPALRRLHADLTALPVPPRLDPVELEGLPFEESIELRDLCFAYPGIDRPVLDGLSVTIPRKGSVAFVGGTGAGKTTLVNLLLGLLSPTSGGVFVDGEPLEQDRIAAWQRSVGYVPQDIFLLDDTVARNIAFGVFSEPVDRERLEGAARTACLHQFIVEQLPEGYDTVIGERGIRLSGGQRQRLGIARALYTDPCVLILDEATSALDGSTEAEFLEAVANLAGTRTLVMIAHRLSTIKNCDQIYLLEGGRLTDRGTYPELLERNETFRGFARGIPTDLSEGTGTPPLRAKQASIATESE